MDEQGIIKVTDNFVGGLSKEQVVAIKLQLPIIKYGDKIKYENYIFLFLGCSFLASISQKAIEQLNSNEIQLKASLESLLAVENLTDELIESVKYDLNKYFHPLLGVIMVETSGCELEIEKYLQEVENELDGKYNYIKSINKIGLGNFLKALKPFPYKRLLASVRHNKEDLLELQNLMIKKKGRKKAPFVKEALANAKKKYLPNNELKAFELSEVELLHFKIGFVSKMLGIDIKEVFANVVYSNIEFRRRNKKGLASILYGLFRLLPYFKLPTYEEWFAIKNESAEMDDRNTWAQFQKRCIEKIMNFK